MDEQTQQTTAPAPAPEPMGHDDGYDTGLVHDHGWACSERGAPTHR